MAEQKTKVIVVIPRREYHPGFWSLGQTRGQGVFFPVGKTEVEVTAAELEELKADEARNFLTLVEISAGERLVTPEKPSPVQVKK